MDTVEWGTGDPAPGRPGRVRSLAAAAGGRRVAVVLAVLGIVALIAAELLPWATLHATVDGALPVAGPAYSFGGRSTLTIQNASQPDVYTVGLSQIGDGSALVYRFGTMLLLAMVGAVLLARPAQRRLASGVGFGLLAAQVVVVVGIVHSFGTILPPTGTAIGGSGYRQSVIQLTTDVTGSDIQPGTVAAFASLALLLGALMISVLPDRVRSRLVAAAAEPPDAQFTDEPADLTVAPAAALDLAVSPASPADESSFARPDRQPPQSFRRPDAEARRVFGPPDPGLG